MPWRYEEMGIEHDVVLYIKEPPDETTLRTIGADRGSSRRREKDSKFKN